MQIEGMDETLLEICKDMETGELRVHQVGILIVTHLGVDTASGVPKGNTTLTMTVLAATVPCQGRTTDLMLTIMTNSIEVLG